MRARPIVVALALLASSVAGAADLDQACASRRIRVRTHVGYEAVRVAPPPGPIVLAPRATVLVVPPEGPQPGLAYVPPPVPVTPPPLIAAIPIIGEYLVPAPLGPPPATVLDAYDHRNDYNQ